MLVCVNQKGEENLFVDPGVEFSKANKVLLDYPATGIEIRLVVIERLLLFVQYFCVAGFSTFSILIVCT